MSGIFKALGKAFKAVVKTVKKIALPALAIGAVVLTGGAALGVLPATGALSGVGGLASSLGLSSTMTSVLTTAATSATIGAGMAAVTGGNILKGATSGFLAGAAVGGVGAALGGTGGAAAGAAGNAGTSTANTASSFASKVATAPGLDVIDNGLLRAGGVAAATGGGTGLGSALASSGTASGLAAATGAGGGVLAPVVSSAPAISSAGSVLKQGAGVIGKGLGAAFSNPVVAGSIVNGLGQGILGAVQAKAEAAEKQKERDAIAANYADTSGLPTYSSPAGGLGYANAADYFDPLIFAGNKIAYDRNGGRIYLGA